MGILLSTLNLLLPFTHPETPLAQDLIHTAILFATLYYAPQIAEYYHAHYAPATATTSDTAHQIPNQHDGSVPDTPDEPIPVDENFVIQPDTDNEDIPIDPPPHAPTPPLAAPQPPPQEAAAWQDGDPGPAERPQPTRANRVIGAKKAKSLARRDQRRAYNEFLRSNAEQRRLEEEEGREEREAALAKEKARRAEVEREIAEREREERLRKREEERREQEEELKRRERVVARVREEIGRKGAVDLVDVAIAEGKDRVWVERLVRASGMMAQMGKEEGKVMITEEGWLVKIDAELMEKAYADAVAFGDSRDGMVSFADFGGILEKAVRARALTAS
ncbi:hypothetical protein N0V90_011816 [Kalmusia sp. IMI 367209]|nr:hypothetical protein N0V90_011816 [Kalmusia sp. IMI 367209]